MGIEIDHGVNDHGVQWVKEGNTYYCVYYYGEGVEVRREYIDTPRDVIDKLTPEQLNENK